MRLLISMTAAALSAAAWAETPPDLAKTLEGLSVQGDVVASVDVRTRKTAGMGAGIHIVAGAGGVQRPPFAGRLEVWQAKEGPTVIVTPSELHGFGIYRGGDQGTVVSTTALAGQEPGLDRLQDELPALMDARRLAKWAGKAEWTKTASEGATTFQGRLDARVLGTPRQGMIPGIEPQVMHVEAKLVVNADGALTVATFDVVRSDPTPALMRLGGGQLPAGVQPPKDDGKVREGERTTYSFTFGAKTPSRRAAAFRERIEALIAAEEE